MVVQQEQESEALKGCSTPALLKRLSCFFQDSPLGSNLTTTAALNNFRALQKQLSKYSYRKLALLWTTVHLGFSIDPIQYSVPDTACIGAHNQLNYNIILTASEVPRPGTQTRVCRLGRI